MALFDKLFPRLKVMPQLSHEESNGSHKLSSFRTKQVRLVLFRECDFRGRKLLFDSNATEKILMEKAEQDKTFVEVSNGYGYSIISKPNAEYQQLSEMVFGSVAMSFRGTYLKIHSLSLPSRLMFTQVFPSPHSRRSVKSSTSSNQSHLSTQSSSFEHSIKLDDSGANSAFSTSDRLSDRSTASDTVLVYRRLQSSPLDVPRVASSFSKNSLVVDSGCADQSFSSISTGPLTFPTWESVFSNKDMSTFSTSSGVFKRLLRSSTRSLQSSSVSLPNSTEVLHKSNYKASKLGLTIVLEISSEKEKFLIQFFMEHIALLEALIWRTHRAVESAYHHPSTFISLMTDIAQNTASWLVNLVHAPHLVTNLWHCLSFGCDSYYNSINAFITDLDEKSANLCRTFRYKSGTNGDRRDSLSNSWSGWPGRDNQKEMFWGFSFSRLFKSDWDRNGRKRLPDKEFIAEKFLREFCELLEGFDVKDTNFFISTLLTAILTHHLGWVATVFPPSTTTPETIFNTKQPYNALWSQLTDLYGAIGHPIKTAQTVITGNNKNNVVSKLVNSLTYFVRCGNVERRRIIRSSIEEENKMAASICLRNNCIPKENFKKYEDHLKEMLTPESPKACCSDGSEKNPYFWEGSNIKKGKSLTKTKSYCRLSGLGLEENGLESHIAPALSKVPSSLGDILKSNMLKSTSTRKLQDFALEEGCDENQNRFSPALNNKTDLEQGVSPDDKKNVIFVLGDNEKLVGLKKEDVVQQVPSSGVKRKVSLAKRPSSLNLSKVAYGTETKNVEHQLMHSSFESLCLEGTEKALTNVRAQSEPPEIRKSPTQTKYRYSRVKFNLQQYPQVVKNYMKSKNIELEGLSLGEKVFDKFATIQNNIKLDLSGYDTDSEEVEALQTPSNASELEFTPDMGLDVTREDSKEADSSLSDLRQAMRIVNIPMPQSLISDDPDYPISYTATVIKGLVDTYIPDMVLQGTTSSKHNWDSNLKSNLAMNAQHSLLDQPVNEALAIVANTDTWEVQIMSSHTYVIDKSTNGVRAGMSQLVANMLESLLQMWKLHIPPQHCILHIEQRLQELCVRSKALAQLLLASEFCSIESLTSTLRIEVNDVPLLMAVASTHTPEVTHKYGLSFH